MPTVTGTSVKGRQTLVTLPNTITSIILLLPVSVISPPIRYGDALLQFVYGTFAPVWDAKPLYGDGVYWTSIPLSGTVQRRIVVVWDVSKIGWRIDY